jgi:arsenite-transporting ATPase
VIRVKNDRPQFVTDPGLSLLIFGGKGGVGKTTSASASALAIAAARPQARVLLLSTDPAHSVADCLNGAVVPANLCVLELSAEEEHRAFMDTHAAHLKTIAARGTFLDADDIDKFVRLSIPGVDELMAYLRVARCLSEDSYDTIVIDTAPSGHTLKLLAMSEILGSWLEALEALMAKHRYMASMFARAGRTPADPTDRFLEDFRDQIETLAAVLCDERRCRFVPVLLAEPMSIAETLDIVAKLEDMGVACPELIMNRLIDEDSGNSFSSQLAAQHEALAELPAALGSRAIWGAPLDAAELIGSERLARFIASLAPISRWARPRRALETARASLFRSDGVATLPVPANKTQLLFYAGKGGVGKTTMACAAAAQLSECGRKCLLVSTDPAHSLGDCLGVALGDEATQVAPGLEAVEIDAEQEFEQLRSEYRDELEEVLESMFSTIDITFDREAMESLLDLAPPGLDECMALLRILDHLDRVGADGEPLHDTIVIDTAPTGHLLRLLELPELIEGWLNCIFALFIKYDRVFRLPRLQARLIAISRGIKKLRTAMADDSRCHVQVVSIPTEMALAECGDLIASLGKMHISVGTLFINLALLPDQSTLGKAVGARELLVRAKYASSFPAINTVTVYRCGDPRGITHLRELAAAIYGHKVQLREAA